VVEGDEWNVTIDQTGVPRHDESRQAAESDRLQERDQESGLVLAVAVPGPQNVAAGVRLPAADSEINGDVVDLQADEVVKATDLLFGSFTPPSAPGPSA